MKSQVISFIGCIAYLTGLAQEPVAFKEFTQVVPGSSHQFKMVPINGGSFTIGTRSTEPSHQPNEGPQKTVQIAPFWIGAFEVSRDAFDVFYKDENTSQNSKVDAVTRPSPQYIDLSLGMGKEGGFPVNSLSQHGALMYCRWLYDKTGIFYRLPTEAEWEYACRAGSTTPWNFGNNAAELGKYAWFKNNSDNKFHKSGEKLPNAWGLYDMLGNVSEWTLDHYDASAFAKRVDKALDSVPAPTPGRYPKVTKGGGFTDAPELLRSGARVPSDPSWNRRDPQIPKSKWWLTEASFVGFRLVRPQQQPDREAVNQFFKTYLGN
ncbi:MAG: SUMF1/EgtB/PvdO family nonheme iron enzyme [Bacteroidota bacterium]